MGALNPLFLVAALAVGVPIFLHLFQRHEARRISFPALRYLARTEREHARRIRSRQLLLLLLRVLIVLCLVGAGAGLFMRGRGGSHPPTALAIVIDNSMSSGLVEGDTRTLDRLKALALGSLDLATEGDRIWVLEAARPWTISLPGGPPEARSALESIDVSSARGDLTASLARAADLVRTSGMEHVEVHLLSDLQASAFTDAPSPAGSVPLVVLAAGGARPVNRGIVEVLVGGGLPPLQGQRSEVTARSRSSEATDSAPVAVRVVVDERVRGAATLPPGAALSLPLPPAPAGWVKGYVDQDADALRADDRRYFAFRARPPPAVAVAGDLGLFVTEALSVLEAAGRLVPSPPGVATVLVSGAAEGMGLVRPGRAAIVAPPSDPTQLPALNRRLGEGGIPWRFERRVEPGEVALTGDRLPEPLKGVTVRQAYRISLVDEPPAPTGTLAEAAGSPWLVDGVDAGERRYLLVGSPLDQTSTSLPVSASMVRFMDWVVSEWAQAGGGGTPEIRTGDPLPAPRPADRVALPNGDTLAIDGTRMLRETGEAGFYTFLAGDSVVSVEALNPPPEESDLGSADPDVLRDMLGSDVTLVGREGGWERAVFRARQGPRMSRPLLVAALILLLLEAFVASAGRQAAPIRPASAAAGSVGGET